MSFIKKSVPPPTVEKGERFLTKILKLEYPVESTYGEETREQIKWRLQLPKQYNGYEATVWTAYYKEPSDRSILGQLCIAYMKIADEPFDNVDDVLEAIRKHGQVYIECTGHRKWKEQEYPKFQIHPNKLPGNQKQIEETQQNSDQPVVVTDEVMQLIDKVIDKEALAKLPMEQQNRILKKLALQLDPGVSDTT